MNTHHGSVSLEEAADALHCQELTGEETLQQHTQENHPNQLFQYGKCDNVFEAIKNPGDHTVNQHSKFQC